MNRRHSILLNLAMMATLIIQACADSPPTPEYSSKEETNGLNSATNNPCLTQPAATPMQTNVNGSAAGYGINTDPNTQQPPTTGNESSYFGPNNPSSGGQPITATAQNTGAPNTTSGDPCNNITDATLRTVWQLLNPPEKQNCDASGAMFDLDAKGCLAGSKLDPQLCPVGASKIVHEPSLNGSQSNLVTDAVLARFAAAGIMDSEIRTLLTDAQSQGFRYYQCGMVGSDPYLAFYKINNGGSISVSTKKINPGPWQ